ncbi:efflux RND transporter permease subunit [Inmirania thermothiophila]|uniref:Multidrug efflux pump subunit AcrB n=1 Tax=Inmirania thermothiophila TaxID=1750597 RepID=A0A3N1Y6K8_9GAMM|nr:efflux RND transporter permease subunit [Inmirania thermothiophila]ROR34415.1 multidrug efflux pump subunit AcrB [Inmirania thermothiophila]
MIAWFARNEVAANLLMAAIMALGLWSLAGRLPLEVFPAIERDVVEVAVAVPGATPREVEEGVVTRIEEAVADLEGIARIASYAYEGAGRVSVEVEEGTDPRELLDEIRNRVDAITAFPAEAERPRYAVSVSRREVISVVVSGALGEDALRRIAEQVRDELARLPGVAAVELAAVRPRELAIEVPEAALDRLGLTLDEVVEAVRRHALDLPAGSLRTPGAEILLSTRAQPRSAEGFAAIPVLADAEGGLVRLGEIATVRDGFEETPLETRFDGRPALVLDVYRSARGSAIEVGRAVRDYVAAAQARLPEGVRIDYWRDRSRIVRLRLETLAKSAWQGGLVVFVLLALFLRVAVAVWVCLGIPVAFLGTLALLPDLGITLNIISLFGFILMLGVVVDDAIVTGENIYAHLRRGEAPLQAAVAGTREVAVPVTFGMLTTAAAFAPLMMVPGVRGQLFAQIALVAIVALVFSWLESKLILPAHMRHVRARETAPSAWARLQHAVADGLEAWVARAYGPFLARVLAWRYAALALFVAVSVAVLAIAASGRYGFTYFPRVASEVAQATLQMEPGTPAEVTAAEIARIAAAAAELEARYTDPASGESVIRHILVRTGATASGGSPGRRGGSPTLGQVALELVPPEERTVAVTTPELVQAWRRLIGDVPGARSLTFRAEIGRSSDPIEIELSGPDLAALRAVAAQVRGRLAGYAGVFDIEDDFDRGQPEIELRLRPQAARYGLDAATVARQVRAAFHGAEVQRLQRGRDEVRVMVRHPEAERRSVATLERLRIRTPDGAAVPLARVAELHLGRGLTTIRHLDRRRVVTVHADADKGRVDLNAVARDLAPFLDGLAARHPGLAWRFGGELAEQRETFGRLAAGTALLLFAIYALLAIPLRSYVQPLIVMLVIPFSLVGAFLGHVLMGMDLSIMSVMGLLALAGVVVNDSLVLVDWTNRHRARGMALAEAVRAAGVARFRPILLTSLTTFGGLAPIIFERSTQAQFLIPMAVSLGFGVLYATLLSLVLVPVGYLILEDLRRLVAGLRPAPARP